VLAQDISLRQARGLLKIFKHNVLAIRAYVPQVYTGPVTLFSSAKAASETPRDETMGWRKWVTQAVTVHPVPGNHQTMLRQPNVETLADLMKTHLDQNKSNSVVHAHVSI
jgi:thioesterase domain-containing protein